MNIDIGLILPFAVLHHYTVSWRLLWTW